MALADKIQGAPARKPTGRPCSVGELLTTLDPSEQGALHQMLYELGYSQTRIYEELVAEGHVVGRQTINRHRSRACSCFNGAAA